MPKLIKHQPAVAPKISIKQVMILESEAFLDASVKVKPHKDNPELVVFKCTNKHLLLQQVAAAGLVPMSSMVRGQKHFILTFKVADLQRALEGVPSPSFPAISSKQLSS